MEILMKSYEDRFYPAGHVSIVKDATLAKIRYLFDAYSAEDGKRTGSAEFKTEADDKWLNYEDFVLKYFGFDIKRPAYKDVDTEAIGWEEDGTFMTNEKVLERLKESREEAEVEREEYKSPTKEERLARLIEWRDNINQQIKELNENPEADDYFLF
ncbi:hypothetical protein COF09_16510 [Bacillus toyonensis]|uniref:hypothetical protein n=1 Tax=Bacillus toyonensis TaxID=155322 RepID=UPI000BFCE8DF|nr:hypothetical protein [Bacillus toyonensis]PHC41313.1 hypothetical protein COF09_16510 [Bacillus toyonensis]